jgi:hypothetical protein
MLKKVELHEAYLTRSETEELMTLARQRPKHLLPNIETFSWENFFENVEMEPTLADRELFELMLDTLQVAFPHIQDQFGQCI